MIRSQSAWVPSLMAVNSARAAVPAASVLVIGPVFPGRPLAVEPESMTGKCGFHPSHAGYRRRHAEPSAQPQQEAGMDWRRGRRAAETALGMGVVALLVGGAATF